MSIASITTGSNWNTGTSSLTIKDLYTINVNGTPYSSGGGPPTGSIIPGANSTYTLGDSSFKYLRIYGDNLYGQIQDPNQLNIRRIGALTGSLSCQSIVPITNDLYSLGGSSARFSAIWGRTADFTGDLLVESVRISSFLSSPGIVHSDNTGRLSSSLIVNGDITAGTIANNKLAGNPTTTLSNNTIMLRDGSGGFEAGAAEVATLQITTINVDGILHADATGNVDSSLIVDADIDPAAGISNGKLAGNPQVIKSANTIMLRDVDGNFAAGRATLDFIRCPTFTTSGRILTVADSSGNINANLGYSSALFVNQLVARDSLGDFTANRIYSDLTGTVTGSSSLNLLLTGGTLSGSLSCHTLTTTQGVSTMNTAGNDNQFVLNQSVGTKRCNMYFNNSGQRDLEFGLKDNGLSYVPYMYSNGVSGSSDFVFLTNNVLDFFITGDMCPKNDNAKNLGKAGNRWKDIWATNPVINTSTIEEKEQVIPSLLGLAFINLLNPVQYKWKDYTTITTPDHHGRSQTIQHTHLRKHYGLIAEEVKNVMDSLNISTNDAAFYIDDAETGKKGLRYIELIAPMIKAIQELSDRVELLESGA